MKRLTPKHAVFALLAAALLASPVVPWSRADSIVLIDGSRVDGSVRKVEGGYEVTLENGTRRIVRSEQVRQVSITTEVKLTDEQARERLASLRRTLDGETDVARAIDRYEKFLAQVDKVPLVAEQAKKDLDLWKSRRDGGMVRVGKRWVTPDERKQIFERSLQTIDQIRSLAKQNRIREAQDLLRTALEEDPANPSYLYLNGVMAARRSAWGEANRAFEETSKLAGDHAPTLANRAMIAAQNKRWPNAVAMMEQALALEPNNPTLVDNAAELLQMVPENGRRGPAFEKLMRRFAEQDQALQQGFAQRGLYRWGSGWVSKEKLDEVKKARAAYEAQKADLQKQFDEATGDARRKQAQIDENARAMDRIQRDSVAIDADGRPFRRPLPDTYWQYDRDNQQLKSEIAELEQKVDALKRQAADLERDEPNPPFHGSMALIAEDGVPVVVPPGVLPDGATTQPGAPSSTRPAAEPGPRIAPPLPAPTTQP